MTLPNSWHADWSSLTALVLGLGKSGFSVVDTLREKQVSVTCVAASADPELVDLVDVIGGKFIATEEPAVLDELPKIDFAVVSPGFAPNHPLVLELQRRQIRLTTDVELAWLLRDKVVPDQKWLGVTGTNGKTTTVELLAHMLASAGQRVSACGNIGNPILDAIRDPVGYEYLVVELSSFQLHYLGEINLEVSAFLNFAEDHFDWHGSEANYLAAKSKIYQGTKVAIVFNEQDAKTLEAAQNAEVAEGCRGIGFSLFTPQPSSVGYVEDILVDRAFLEERKDNALEIATEADIAEISPLSDQLKANVAAAAAMARAVGVAPAAIRAAIRSFEISPHRNQLVANISGIKFVNDSKATNAHAAAGSLASYESIIWILGGLFKGVDPAELIEEFAPKIKAAVIIGSDTSLPEERFAGLAPQVPLRVISGEDVMDQAVRVAFELAAAGDTVLLAPAAASMDQFRDYQDRGNQFIAAVRRLAS